MDVSTEETIFQRLLWLIIIRSPVMAWPDGYS